MKNKKAIMASTLVTVIALAIVFYVILNLYSGIIAILRGFGEDYFWCLLKKIISAYTKTPIGGVVVWGAFCPPIVNTITLTTKGDNLIPIDTAFTKRDINNLEKWYPGENIKDRDWRLRYKLDESIAQGVKTCWGRNGEGKLPLGPQWNDEFLKVADTIFYCDLCTVYKSNDDIKDIFDKQNGLSLNEFLQRNPKSPGSSESLFEHLTDKDFESSFHLNYIYYTNKDIAIVYVRRNINNFNEFLRDLRDILPGFNEKDHPTPIDQVIIIPFDQYETLNCKT
jgi:hypothetical protein